MRFLVGLLLLGLVQTARSQTIATTVIDCSTIKVTITNTTLFNQAYIILRSADGGTTFARVLHTDLIQPGDVMAFDDTGLNPNTNYTYGFLVAPVNPHAL